MTEKIKKFFLGGYDLEMVTIRDLLAKEAPGRFYDRHLFWGAKTSDYRQEIENCLAKKEVPVLIELTDDLNLDPESVTIIVDHHGERAGVGKPTSLHQVFDLLGLPPDRWTRWFELVAANDRGYIPALVEAGASREEIIRIRAADRSAQGITPGEEREGEIALRSSKTFADGLLTVIRLPHKRTACVVDRLQPELGGTGCRNLLVVSPNEVNFFGDGRIIAALNEKYPGGWFGGALPVRGFWGINKSLPDILPYLKAILNIKP